MTLHTRLALYMAIALTPRGPRLTSADVEERTGINATQVRRDLTQALGQIGKRGVGYKPAVLAEQLRPLVEKHADQIKLDATQQVTNGVLVLARLRA